MNGIFRQAQNDIPKRVRNVRGASRMTEKLNILQPVLIIQTDCYDNAISVL